MRIPKVTGVIRRRFLINFRIDSGVLSKVLPKPFKPKLYNGYGIGGICLIRLEQIKPKVLPFPLGVSSENAAHRFAVEWDSKEGVYIPRRDSDSILNQLLGGSLFPGIHHAAIFDVKEEDVFNFHMKSKDSEVEVSFSGEVNDTMPEGSCFQSVSDASNFFETGSLGYSDTSDKKRYDGLSLVTSSWSVQPFNIDKVYSSYFSDRNVFPEGSIEFDHALFMSNINHEWHQEGCLCCA